MKYVYILASAAAKNPKSEQPLWDALRDAGLQVRDIHAFPHVTRHDVAIADPAVARLAKKRLVEPEKEARVICLAHSAEVLAERMRGLPAAYAEKAARDAHLLRELDADYCVPADDLDAAARQIIRIIRDLEVGF